MTVSLLTYRLGFCLTTAQAVRRWYPYVLRHYAPSFITVLGDVARDGCVRLAGLLAMGHATGPKFASEA